MVIVLRHRFQTGPHGGWRFGRARPHGRVMRIMAMGAAVDLARALPAPDPFPVDAEGPVLMYGGVTLGTDLVGLVETHTLTGQGGQLIARFRRMAVQAPDSTVAMVQRSLVRRHQLATFRIGGHRRVAGGAGIEIEFVDPADHRDLGRVGIAGEGIGGLATRRIILRVEPEGTMPVLTLRQFGSRALRRLCNGSQRKGERRHNGKDQGNEQTLLL